eukprot:3992027-Amphidinium_carterae.3
MTQQRNATWPCLAQKGKGYSSNYPSYHKGEGKGKYGSRPYNVKGKGKGYKGYNNYIRPKGRYNNYGRGKGKGKGSKRKPSYNNHPPLPPYKGKGSTKGKGRGTNIVCYYCGKPGHTSDKCWWKGQIYNIDQSQPVWSVPNDNQPQQLQQLPLH